MNSKNLLVAFKGNVAPYTLILVVILVWNMNDRRVQASRFRYSRFIINKFKARLCTMYSNKYSYCKEFIQTTTEADDTIIRRPENIAQETTMIDSTTVNSLQGFDNLITSPSTVSADEVERSGVTVLENYRHATMLQGPSDLRLVSNNSQTVFSQLGCATSCINSEWCLGMAFSRSKRFCLLMTDNVMQFGELIPESGWKLYFITPT